MGHIAGECNTVCDLMVSNSTVNVSSVSVADSNSMISSSTISDLIIQALSTNKSMPQSVLLSSLWTN